MLYRCKSPSKIILSGEHAVVKGFAAVALAIDLPVTVEIKKSSANKTCIRMQSPHSKSFIEWNQETLLENASLYDPKITPQSIKFNQNTAEKVAAIKPTRQENINKLSKQISILFLSLYFALGLYDHSLEVTIESEIPISGGMGSSAAASCSLAGALLELKNHVEKRSENNRNELINKLALECEKLNHGSPSGIDNTAIMNGGLVLFQHGLKRKISDSKFAEYFNKTWRMLLIDSGVSRDTKKLISNVKSVHEKNPNLVEKIFSQMGADSENLFAFFEAEFGEFSTKIQSRRCDSVTKLNEVIKRCQSNLCDIGTSVKEIDDIVQLCQSKGFEAKLTGSGGGGAVLCILPRQSEPFELRELLEENGFSSYEAAVQMGGVISMKLSE